jgi:1,4-alpha-glucan branching enzyme
MIHKRMSKNGDKVIVAFEIPGSVWADQIHLVGDFNDWNRESLPLRRNGRDDWRVEVELDRGREYHFRYLIDGDNWRSEWRADRHVAGSDGAYDSVVIAQLPQVG